MLFAWLVFKLLECRHMDPSNLIMGLRSPFDDVCVVPSTGILIHDAFFLQLCGDVDVDVRHGSQHLDRLLKDIVLEACVINLHVDRSAT